MSEQRQDLKEQMTYVIEEARMVLPGIQALFGFQTIAFFNERFQDLSQLAVNLHQLALILVVLGIGLLMTPAAYHRIVEPGTVTRHTVAVASRLLQYSMIPLSIAISLDVYVVLTLVPENFIFAVGASIGVWILLTGLWIFYPYLCRRRRNNTDSK